AALEPVGHQLGDAARIHHRAGDPMRADLLSLLEDGDRQRLAAAVRFRELRETVRGGEAGRPGADDDDVDVQGLALDAGKLCHAFSSEGRNRAAFYRTMLAHMSPSSRRWTGVLIAVALVAGTLAIAVWRLRVAHQHGWAGFIAVPQQRLGAPTPPPM